MSVVFKFKWGEFAGLNIHALTGTHAEEEYEPLYEIFVKFEEYNHRDYKHTSHKRKG